MNLSSGKSAESLDLHAIDIFEFARSERRAAGVVRLSQLPRMLNEVPATAPDRDSTFTWQAEGAGQREAREDGAESLQPYLRLVLHGTAWLKCHRCLEPYLQMFDASIQYRIVVTEEEAEAYPLDDDGVDVIVGAHEFDFLNLIEEELLLSLPLVPKHEDCPQTHESLLPMAVNSESEQVVDKAPRGNEKPNPFAVLEALKKGVIDGGKDKA